MEVPPPAPDRLVKTEDPDLSDSEEPEAIASGHKTTVQGQQQGKRKRNSKHWKKKNNSQQSNKKEDSPPKNSEREQLVVVKPFDEEFLLSFLLAHIPSQRNAKTDSAEHCCDTILPIFAQVDNEGPSLRLVQRLQNEPPPLLAVVNLRCGGKGVHKQLQDALQSVHVPCFSYSDPDQTLSKALDGTPDDILAVTVLYHVHEHHRADLEQILYPFILTLLPESNQRLTDILTSHAPRVTDEEVNTRSPESAMCCFNPILLNDDAGQQELRQLLVKETPVLAMVVAGTRKEMILPCLWYWFRQRSVQVVEYEGTLDSFVGVEETNILGAVLFRLQQHTSRSKLQPILYPHIRHPNGHVSNDQLMEILLAHGQPPEHASKAKSRKNRKKRRTEESNNPIDDIADSQAILGAAMDAASPGFDHLDLTAVGDAALAPGSLPSAETSPEDFFLQPIFKGRGLVCSTLRAKDAENFIDKIERNPPSLMVILEFLPNLDRNVMAHPGVAHAIRKNAVPCLWLPVSNRRKDLASSVGLPYKHGNIRGYILQNVRSEYKSQLERIVQESLPVSLLLEETDKRKDNDEGEGDDEEEMEANV